MGRIVRITSYAAVLTAVLALSASIAAPVAASSHSCDGERATVDDHDGAIVGTPERDVIVGNRGINDIRGRGGNDLICGRGGDDDISGGSGNDDLFGDTGDDGMSGGAGDDHFSGADGSDTMDGGDGFNTALFGGAEDGVVVDLDGGSASGEGEDTLLNFNGAQGSPGDDYLSGTNEDDLLSGGDGNDTFVGLGGVDGIRGGAKTDTITYLRSKRRVVIDLTNREQEENGDNSDFLNSIENVEGSPFDDQLKGNRRINSIRAAAGDDEVHGFGNADDLLGNRGNDRLFGNAGNDTLTGGPGRDRLAGGDGRDTLRGGPGTDTCIRQRRDSRQSCERD